MKAANVSVAMRSGNAVATEVAHIVLLDDNIASLLALIKTGRLTYRNIRKVIIYLIPGGCVGQLVPNIMSIFFGFPTTLTNFAQSIISYVTDPASSVAMIMEKEESDVMLQQPRTTSTHLVDWRFFFQAYALVGSLIAASSVGLYFVYMSSYAQLAPVQLAFTFGAQPAVFSNTTASGLTFDEYLYTGQSVTFFVIIATQVFGNLLVHKTNKRSFFEQVPWHATTRNLWVYAAGGFQLVCAIFALYFGPFQAEFNTRPVPVVFYVAALVAGLVIFGLDELRKLCVRMEVFYVDRIAW